MNQLSTRVSEVADEIYTGRVIRDGQVAVLFSPGFGAGWSSWNPDFRREMTFDPWIVDLLLNESYNQDEKHQRIEAHCNLKYPGAYLGGVGGLQVAWVPEGTLFRIEEYDGSESIEIHDISDWIVA